MLSRSLGIVVATWLPGLALILPLSPSHTANAIVAGVAAAAAGSGLAGLGAAGSAVGIAVGAALLYAGFVAPARVSALSWPVSRRAEGA